MHYPKLNYLCLAAFTAVGLFTSPALHAAGSDDQIESSFTESHVYRTHLNEDDISIDAEDGVVTLSGTVASKSNKDLAEDTAAALVNVTRVISTIQTEEEVDEDSSDKWIERKVNFSLLFHRNVAMGSTTVDVENGIVTLSGKASSQAQKDLTGEYASDIDGVESVVNNITVTADSEDVNSEDVERTPGEKIDDASVTAQVKSVLKNHRSTRETDIKVITRTGKVTLTGIARNDAEKALVSKMVSNVKGVDNVNNEMTVHPVENL
ncbi:MAG: BON domain-containing protein [Kiritimatiellia bacterium]